MRNSGSWSTGFMEHWKLDGHRKQEPDFIYCPQRENIINPIILGKKEKLSCPASHKLEGRLVPSVLQPLSDSSRHLSLSSLLPLSAGASWLVFSFLLH